MADDLVVLVNEQDRELGVMPKAAVHSDKTPLHRGLSVFVFNQSRQVLVQQRAQHKLTWPGVWSNSCCGHPGPGESYEAAAVRKVHQELGLEVAGLVKVADYRYRFERGGVVENEICPVFQCWARGRVNVDPAEVADWKWIEWEAWMKELQKDLPGAEGKWSEWCKEEVLLLDPLPGLK